MYMLTLESRCISEVGGGVLILRTLANHQNNMHYIAYFADLQADLFMDFDADFCICILRQLLG